MSLLDLFKKNDANLISDIIQDIKYNNKFKEYEGKTFIDIFNRSFEVNFTTSVDYAEKCINSLSNKKLYDDICNSLVKLCNEEVKHYLDEEEYASLYKLPREQILFHVSDLSIIIDDFREDSIGYCIAGNCDWNEEHGFIVVICNNEIKHIGEHDNIYNPWDEYK